MAPLHQHISSDNFQYANIEKDSPTGNSLIIMNGVNNEGFLRIICYFTTNDTTCPGLSGEGGLMAQKRDSTTNMNYVLSLYTD